MKLLKYLFKIFSSFLFLTAFLVFSATGVSAKVMSNENGTVTVAKGEVINDDLFVGAQTVQIDGVVNGDVFAGGQSVNVNGMVNGNLHAGGGNININGQIKGSTYLGGGNITVNKSLIGGTLVIGGGNVSIDKDTVIGGSLVAGTGNMSLDATVKRSVFLGAGDAKIGPDTKISKDLYYAVGNDQAEITIPSTASISGNIYKSDKMSPPKTDINKDELNKVLRTTDMFGKVVGFLGAVLVGFIYLKVFEKHLTLSSSIVLEHFSKSLGTGFLISIAFIPALIILMITVIGIPLAGVSFLVLMLGFYLSKIVAGLAFGQYLSAKFNLKKLSAFWLFVLGFLILSLFRAIPVIGFFTGVVMLWSGLGALALSFTSKNK